LLLATSGACSGGGKGAPPARGGPNGAPSGPTGGVEDAGGGGGGAGGGSEAGAGGGGTGGASAADASDADAPAAVSKDAAASSDGGPAAPVITGTGGCPGNPAGGWTEFMDTYKVQHPYDLQESDRFKVDNGEYTAWVLPNDKPHQPNNTTAPRTEMRWSNWTTGERMWEADMMFESPLNHTCIMQIHNVGAAIAVYLQVNAGDVRNAAGGTTFLKGYYDKWFNLKVAFNPDTLTARVWVNNCLMGTTKAPRGPDPNWYFKNGVYTCNAPICRDHFRNIRFWKP
jgi:hypothetical protein